MGNHDSKPCASIFGPPIPTKLRPGTRSRSAAIRWAPRKSPEASPATMPTRMRSRSTALAHDASPRTLEEFDHYPELRRLLRLLRDRCPRLFQREARPVQGLVRAPDLGDLPLVEAAALQSFGVDPERLAF